MEGVAVTLQQIDGGNCILLHDCIKPAMSSHAFACIIRGIQGHQHAAAQACQDMSGLHCQDLLASEVRRRAACLMSLHAATSSRTMG